MIANQRVYGHVDLSNIIVTYGRLRYRSCPDCGNRLHRYRRETDHTHHDYARCLGCQRHVGYEGEEHVDIVRQMRASGIGEPLIAFLSFVAGPVTLDSDELTSELGGYGEAVAS